MATYEGSPTQVEDPTSEQLDYERAIAAQDELARDSVWNNGLSTEDNNTYNELLVGARSKRPEVGENVFLDEVSALAEMHKADRVESRAERAERERAEQAAEVEGAKTSLDDAYQTEAPHDQAA